MSCLVFSAIQLISQANHLLSWMCTVYTRCAYCIMQILSRKWQITNTKGSTKRNTNIRIMQPLVDCGGKETSGWKWKWCATLCTAMHCYALFCTVLHFYTLFCTLMHVMHCYALHSKTMYGCYKYKHWNLIMRIAIISNVQRNKFPVKGVLVENALVMGCYKQLKCIPPCQRH